MCSSSHIIQYTARSANVSFKLPVRAPHPARPRRLQGGTGRAREAAQDLTEKDELAEALALDGKDEALGLMDKQERASR
jgi:hypothetical protein